MLYLTLPAYVPNFADSYMFPLCYKMALLLSPVSLNVSYIDRFLKMLANYAFLGKLSSDTVYYLILYA